MEKETHFQRLLKKFDELGLSNEEYVILGSGVLAVRNIRDVQDLDILVLPKTYEKLAEKYSQYQENDSLVFQGMDISYKLKWEFSEADFFQNSEIIDDHRFLSLEKLLEFKQLLWRQKDEEDIILIQKYMSDLVAWNWAQMSWTNLPII